MHEAQKGHVAAKDVFTAIMLLNLLHSLIEDTLLILLIGADFNTIFLGKITVFISDYCRISSQYEKTITNVL